MSSIIRSCHAYLELHAQTKQLMQVTQGICFAGLQQMDKPVCQPLKSVVTTNYMFMGSVVSLISPLNDRS